ncbi:hypothetical protein XENORESO_000344 [Xenotaenia resolanae]|uniref:Uncharacterized protein n=1 Tax=Xenotaenia resolanae TaxID=208358 RepID=A0ABV0VTX4_9TELE
MKVSPPTLTVCTHSVTRIAPASRWQHPFLSDLYMVFSSSQDRSFTQLEKADSCDGVCNQESSCFKSDSTKYEPPLLSVLGRKDEEKDEKCEQYLQHDSKIHLRVQNLCVIISR